jgi:hypothetical protein
MIVHISQDGTSFSFTQDEGKLICKGLKNQLSEIQKKIDEIEKDESVEDKEILLHEKVVKTDFITAFTGFFAD